MNTIRVDNSESFSAPLGERTLIGRVVTELQEVTGFSERRPLEIPAIPLLFSSTC